MTRVLIALLFVFCGCAFAAPPAVTLRPVASGLTLPVEIAHAGDGSGRLFVAEQGGAIKIIKTGAVLATPFLDITAQVLSGGDRGLLSLAFHPQFRANAKFYVYYTRQTDGTIVLSEYLRSAANADVADPATERQLFTVTHPLSNHNGGHIVFGPDGYLYIGIGDGGGGGDQNNNAQNLGVRLGKLLRIEYGHNFASGGFAIVGGYVYRGRKSRALRGFYLYGDNVSNHMWAAAAAENWTPSALISGPGSISSLGEDEAGELYVASLNGGTVHAIDGPAPGVATP